MKILVFNLITLSLFACSFFGVFNLDTFTGDNSNKENEEFINESWLHPVRDYTLTDEDYETAHILDIEPLMIKEIKSRYDNIEAIDKVLKKSVDRRKKICHSLI